MREDRKARIDARRVAPLVAWLCHEQCAENGALCEAAGRFKQVRWERSAGLRFDDDREITIEDIANNWGEIADFSHAGHPRDLGEAMDGLMGDDH